METPLVQSAVVSTPTPPVSGGLGGVPAGGESFALTLGRTLGSEPTPILDAARSNPKASPRQKSPTDSASDFSNMAGLLLSWFMASSGQPVPTVASGASVGGPHLSQVGAAPAAQSTSATTLEASSAEGPGQYVGAVTASTALPSVANLITLSGRVGRVVGKVETGNSEPPKPHTPGAGQIPTDSPNPEGLAPSSPPTMTTPVSTPVILELPAPNGPVGPKIVEVLSPAVPQGFESAPHPTLPASPWQGPNGVRAKEVTGPVLSHASQDLTGRDRSLPLPERNTPLPTQATLSALPTLPALAPLSGEQPLPPPEQHRHVPAPTVPVSTPAPVAQGSTSVSVSPFEPPVPLAATEPASPLPEFARPVNSDLAEVSSWLAKFAGAEVTETKSGRPAVAETTGPASSPLTAVPASGEPFQASASSRQTQFSTEPDTPAGYPVKGEGHSGPLSNASALELASQKAPGVEPTDPRDSLLTARGGATVPTPVANSQPATPATILQNSAALEASGIPPSGAVDARSAATILRNNTAPEANGIPPSGAVDARSGENPVHSNLSDPPTSDQGKSGQKGGPASGNNLTGMPRVAPSLANNLTADTTPNLLTAHAPSVPLTHANTLAPQTPPASSQPPTALSAWQNYDGGAGKIVRSASLSDSANGAEMHVELRSGTLGPLEVRAVVHEGSVGAEIHVEGQEAHTLLTAGLPSLEHALGERNLRVENIAIYQDHAGGGMSGGGEQRSHSESSPSPQHQVLPWDNPPQSRSAARSSSGSEELTDPAAGLSVRA